MNRSAVFCRMALCAFLISSMSSRSGGAAPRNPDVLDSLVNSYRTRVQETRLLEQENRFLALQLEAASSGAVYLIIDLTSHNLILKRTDKTLRTCDILRYTAGKSGQTPISGVRRVEVLVKIPPVCGWEMDTGRRSQDFPFNSEERLIRGASEEGVLYLNNGLMIRRRADRERASAYPCVELDGKDMKAIFRAVKIGSRGIMVARRD